MKEFSQGLLSDPFIFLSYAKEDKEKIEKIYRRLKRDGLKPWLDIHYIQPGHKWDNVIRTAIRKCRFFAIFLSNHSVTKRGYIQREIKEALDIVDELPDNSVFIMPIRLEPCEVPERLKPWQWVDFHRTGGYNRLKASIIQKLGSQYSGPEKPIARPPVANALMDAASDGVLFEYFRQIDSFQHGVTTDKHCVLSDGSFILFRDKFPPKFAELFNVVKNVTEISEEQIAETIPDASTYRTHANEVCTYSKQQGGHLNLATYDGKINRMVDPGRWRFVDLYFSDYEVYLIGDYESVIVEYNNQVVFIMLPTWSEAFDEYDDGSLDNPVEDDVNVLGDLPFDMR